MTLSNRIRRILQTLITLAGAGAGAALTILGLRIFRFYYPDATIPMGILVTIYALACMVPAMVMMYISDHIIHGVAKGVNEVVRHLDNMNAAQLVGCVTGLIAGLIIAALMSQVLGFMGQGVLVTALSAMLYVTLGVVGWTVGWRRGRDVSDYLINGENGKRSHRFHLSRKGRRSHRVEVPAVREKLLDTSAVIDGRIADICHTGFLEGTLVVPQFVLDELRHLADSADPLRRSRGRRGLDLLTRMQSDDRLTMRVETKDYSDITEVDVKLLRLAGETNAAVVTGDYNLNKVATVAGIRVLNVNELTAALRSTVAMGDEMDVTIVKDGKEATQGVGYMEDGTMIVVDGGRGHIGETLPTVVTSVLQTSAGRMVFSKVKHTAAEALPS